MKSQNLFLSAESVSGDLTAVSGVAYGGGCVRQPWCDVPIYVDLDGMAISRQVPLMYNHENEPQYRLGVVSAEITGGKVVVSGGLDTAVSRGEEIARAGRRVKWQLSIGAEIRRAEPVEEETTVNGRAVQPPALIVRESLLREVSVVAVGADAETEMTIAAGWGMKQTGNINNKEINFSQGVKPMEIEKEIEKTACGDCADDTEKVTAEEITEEVKEEIADAVTEEVAEEENNAETPKKEDGMAEEIKQRYKAANVIAALEGAPTEVLVKAVKQGWSVEMAKAVADSVKAVKASKPNGVNVIVKQGGNDLNSIEAALSLRAGIDADYVAKTCGEQATERGYKMRNMSLKDTLKECLKLSGKFSTDYIGHEDIQAGFQTTDLPKLLGNVANKALLKSFEAREIAATKLCSAGDIADYKEATRVRIADIGQLDEIPEGGEVTETAIGEDYAVNQVRRYAQVFWLDEKLIINDDLGAFTRLPQVLGAKAADFVDATFFARLTANANFTDGNALFSSAHKNYATGTTTALDLAALKKAYSAMRKQTDKGGMPINVLPKYLVVPAELEAEALELTTSQTVIGGSNRSAGENVIAKWGLQVVASPYLDANSTKAWYLFGDPSVCDTFEIGYLRGQRTPIVEQGTYDLSRFGVGYRVRFDFGVREMDFRAVYKAKGEN